MSKITELDVMISIIG